MKHVHSDMQPTALLKAESVRFFLSLKKSGRGPQIIQGKKNDAEAKSPDSVDNSSETQEEPH